MTLTTEQLRARAKFWREKAVEAKWESVSIAQDMLLNADAFDELAANREAQPVYQYRMRNPYNGQVTDWETTKPEQVDFILKETIAANVEFRIIAAPPAPAVNAAPDFEAWFNSPEAGLRVVNFHIQHELQLKAWSACHAAMLAQPVSQRYTLPDSVLVLLNHIEDVLDDENWNRICVKKWNAVTMLAAAPEGGNDHDTRR